MESQCIKTCRSLLLLTTVVAIEYCTAQNVVCYTNPNDNCVGETDSNALTVAECCSSTSRRTYVLSGTEICESCPEVTFQCYAQEQCENSSESVTSYLANGESVCCNRSYSAWRVQSDGNHTCNLCPIPETSSYQMTSMEITTSMETVSDENAGTDAVQTDSGCSAGCIAGIVVVGSLALVVIIAAIVLTVIVVVIQPKK